MNREEREFTEALKIILKSEGGFVDDPDDPGGATNKGITQAVYNSWRTARGLDVVSVKDIDDNEIAAIYRRNYWLACGCDEFEWPYSLMLFDSAVNHGVSASRRLRDKSPTYEDFYNARLQLYHDITVRKPNMRKFLKGWENRINNLENYRSMVFV